MVEATHNFGVIETRLATLEHQFQQWTQGITGQIATLSNKIEERSRTQWPIYIGFASILLAAMTYLDAAKLNPLKERDVEIMSIMKDMQKENKENIVPNWVHQREWRYRDDQFTAHSSRVELVEKNMAERIKRLEDMFGSTWNIRDAIQVFQQRIDRLEQSIPKN